MQSVAWKESQCVSRCVLSVKSDVKPRSVSQCITAPLNAAAVCVCVALHCEVNVMIRSSSK